MIKGCKHYFSMFGILLCVVNVQIQKFFASIFAYEKDLYMLNQKIYVHIEKKSVNQNQIYQK